LGRGSWKLGYLFCLKVWNRAYILTFWPEKGKHFKGQVSNGLGKGKITNYFVLKHFKMKRRRVSRNSLTREKSPPLSYLLIPPPPLGPTKCY